jgi:hypothetical protein
MVPENGCDPGPKKSAGIGDELKVLSHVLCPVVPPLEVVTWRLQASIDPESFVNWSTTYRRQVPLGFVPLKTEKLEPRDGEGAGAGKTSLGPFA